MSRPGDQDFSSTRFNELSRQFGFMLKAMAMKRGIGDRAEELVLDVLTDYFMRYEFDSDAAPAYQRTARVLRGILGKKIADHYRQLYRSQRRQAHFAKYNADFCEHALADPCRDPIEQLIENEEEATVRRVFEETVTNEIDRQIIASVRDGAPGESWTERYCAAYGNDLTAGALRSRRSRLNMLIRDYLIRQGTR